jgi:serine/threonine protein kinase
VSEYADSGTLRNYLRENFRDLTWNDKLNLALQLAKAISCLHDQEIVHCDLVGYLLIIINIIKLYCKIMYLIQLLLLFIIIELQ